MILEELLFAVSEPPSIWLRIDLPASMILGIVFLFGAIAGSFLNVCIYRLPQRYLFWESLQGLWSPPSSCPRCRSRILWYDNIPIVGWLLLRGRCRHCKMRISPQYPLIELLNGGLLVLVYWMEVPIGRHAALTESCLYSPIGPQVHPGLGTFSPELWIHLRYLYHVVLIEALVVATMIDFRLRIIPDGCTLPPMAVGLLGAVATGRFHLVPVWFQAPRLARDMQYVGPTWLQGMISDWGTVPAWIDQYPHWHGLAASLAGLLVGGGIVLLVRVVGSWILKQEAMGDGDVVLMAMVGSFLGWQPVVIAFFLAPIAAVVVVLGRLLLVAFRLMPWDEAMPYGPYLSLGTLVTLLGWQSIWPEFERIFGLGPMLLLFALTGTGIFIVILSLIQIIKRWFGISSHPVLNQGEWYPADQNHFFAGEKTDRFTNNWRTSVDWPGAAASRGSLHEERWRHAGHPLQSANSKKRG